jgi:hypothetical protein
LGGVKDGVWLAFYKAQRGFTPNTLKGLGDANVLKIVEDFRTDTYCAVYIYTVQFADVVYTLTSYAMRIYTSAGFTE